MHVRALSGSTIPGQREKGQRESGTLKEKKQIQGGSLELARVHRTQHIIDTKGIFRQVELFTCREVSLGGGRRHLLSYWSTFAL